MSPRLAARVGGEVILLALMLVGTGGCISTHLIKDKAQAHVEFDSEKQQLQEVPSQPGYYALLSLTIPADIVTSPFQLGYLVATGQSHMGMATIHGVPVPLP